ncbi:propionyl-coenzyme A carboxylase alpha polypeptide [Mesorhizobium sp. B2-4-9]|nr:propionyl-coenzyme A carboxylase alpha polypeptide [Mesorhizobium sp. B2-5-2]TPL19090.1 propionyl-coenzyme A carboxylase alpha polypeptide [Mesorhizobium sp. B2-4-9]TPL19322.1 propionyl-coenzyme A carboxylase alpha polypeptide [Mesorhizobium sp. B2-4-7]TPL34572.1 propionyl-coenzyme A carboxylase alpha polypeptide [Mesorhizobium sp. B2-4-5]TPM68860.1 propionyl-coenzyme A carboxylase alpha polypeptide [Mesorhizobium sp. B2-1-6]TPN72267.1 propionyl-coenzyme A carboxylase alpha polypeptide [Mes
MSALRRPPLSCRTSPPLGGRLAVTTAFANLRRCRNEWGAEIANLPLVGEMSGRTEGGAVGYLPPHRSGN